MNLRWFGVKHSVGIEGYPPAVDEARRLGTHNEVVFGDVRCLANYFKPGAFDACLACEGNNVGARAARGKYLLFLNTDTWMEPDCVETLLGETRTAQAAAAMPWVLNYDDNSHQNFGALGFDIFGLPSPSRPAARTCEIFIAGGCCYLIDAAVFKKIGMFDPKFFMYCDEVELSWRVWIAGHRIVGVPRARLHHRGAVSVNPAGGVKILEFRTSDRKRFLSNRNCILTLLKNGQHVIALVAFPLIGFLFLEALVCALLLRRWSFARRTFFDALDDCWRLRPHLRHERRKLATWRQRTDLWMLQRFLRLSFNRWYDIRRVFRFGLPHVDPR